MARREVPEINAGSMADIAFLLLVFFLVTTTMDQDSGIMRILPPPIEDPTDGPQVKEKDVYVVLVNRNDQLLVEDKPMKIGGLKAGAMEFLTNGGVFRNEAGSENLTMREDWVKKADLANDISLVKGYIANSEGNDRKTYRKQLKKLQGKMRTVELVGEYKALPGSALISLQNDKGTSYGMYIQVQNELQSATNQLRDDLSVQKFGVPYSDLNGTIESDKEKIIAIRNVFPQRISEAEPVNY